MKVLQPEEYPGLPKWPLAFITGESVTPQQAKEINFRTDTNFGYINTLCPPKLVSKFGWQPIIDAVNNECTHGKSYTGLDGWKMASHWRKKMGIITSEYLRNEFLRSNYVGGPSGWCHPDGSIYYQQNVGKWPSVQDIVDDWKVLQEHFPFLDLVCTLFSGEDCEDDKVPLVTIIVKNNTVTVIKADMSLHSRPLLNYESISDTWIQSIFQTDSSSATEWPDEWLEEFSVTSKAAMARVLETMT
jgi:hypothetical protein